MTWIEVIPIVTGLLYSTAAVGYARAGEWGWAITYGGYALANAGLIWAAIAGRPG